ncbi:MAG: 3-hydroxyacyl-CoA dehydrogenase [Verrucomicrobiales bacterium]|nr:3-hydroxyacyl-CoA dehydrogenase [Verrucomicrobiales bacterium]
MNQPQVAPSSIRKIGILGAGQMGGAAAVLFRRAGFQVQLWARRKEALLELPAFLESVDQFLEQHFGAAPSKAGEVLLVSDLLTIDSQADAVLECVRESMSEKIELLKQLQGCRERDALVMSCTSALSITEMAKGSGMESVLIGAHFWNPPHLIPVVEVIGGASTPERQVLRGMELLTMAGKIPVRCTDVPGFIGNRLMHAMWREALSMIDAGVCTPEDIDRVVKWTFALRLPALGPMENIDLVGLPLVHSVESYLFPYLATNSSPALALTNRLERGETGMKSGLGFYDWSARDPKATVALRDRQIVRQLQFLQEEGVFKKEELG